MAKSAAKDAKPARPMAKSEIHAELVRKTGLDRKIIGKVLEALGELIAGELGKKGRGVFALPGLLKFKVVRKPATKAKQGVNPFTKEAMTIAAKPARNAVKIMPLKALKDSVR